MTTIPISQPGWIMECHRGGFSNALSSTQVSNILVVNAPLKLHLVDCTHVEMCRFKATHVEVSAQNNGGGWG